MAEHEQVIDAASGLRVRRLGGVLSRCGEDGQGLEDQLVGLSATAPGYAFTVLDNMMIFDPAAMVTTPVGQKSVDWLKTLKPDFVKWTRPSQARRLRKALVRNDRASLIGAPSLRGV